MLYDGTRYEVQSGSKGGTKLGRPRPDQNGENLLSDHALNLKVYYAINSEVHFFHNSPISPHSTPPATGDVTVLPRLIRLWSQHSGNLKTTVVHVSCIIG